MQKLIAELFRLYLAPGSVSPQLLAQHVQGHTSLSLGLGDGEGQARAIALPFRKIARAEDDAHWLRLCEFAGILQTRFGFPAPAVSISGDDGYLLWLSLEDAVPAAQLQSLIELLFAACLPDAVVAPDLAMTPVALPPCLHQGSGLWAAFINPGLGASFTDESGLEMPPPLAGQAALLEGLQSISRAELMNALDMLQPARLAQPSTQAVPALASPASTAVTSLVPPGRGAPEGLLLKDATLEDIVRFLHAKNIEPTFRHLIAMP